MSSNIGRHLESKSHLSCPGNSVRRVTTFFSGSGVKQIQNGGRNEVFLNARHMYIFFSEVTKVGEINMVSVHENAVVIPGERIGSLEQYSPGNGTYIRHGYVYASLAGYKQLHNQTNGEVCKLI